MPNWNYNELTIYAPRTEVKKWLAWRVRNRAYFFNMHKLFPERFGADDKDGFKGWDYDWYVQNTGSKWCAEIYPSAINKDEPGMTKMFYETAWSPNLALIERLHEETSWRMECYYDEPGEAFQ